MKRGLESNGNFDIRDEMHIRLPLGSGKFSEAHWKLGGEIRRSPAQNGNPAKSSIRFSKQNLCENVTSTCSYLLSYEIRKTAILDCTK